MSEGDWPSGIDAPTLLRWLRASPAASERKLRLFACACWRRIRREGLWARLHRVVETAERYADGLAGTKELLDAKSVAWGIAHPVLRLVTPMGVSRPHISDVFLAAYAAEETPAVLAQHVEEAAAWEGLREVAPAVLRDLFGPRPFRPPPGAPSPDGTVERLARAAYEERLLPSGQLDRTRLAVLADALEEAGCTDADLLGHLRGEGAHVRGCWALDLLLAKE